jgi:uncharacterized protein (DUF1330 family)
VSQKSQVFVSFEICALSLCAPSFPLHTIRIKPQCEFKETGGPMSVYAIAQLWIHDPAAYGRYARRFMEVFEKFQGRVLVADDNPLIFAGVSDVNKIVVVTFPDEASFRDWVESPEYLEIAEDRRAGATSIIVLARGIPTHGEILPA